MIQVLKERLKKVYRGHLLILAVKLKIGKEGLIYFLYPLTILSYSGW